MATEKLQIVINAKDDASPTIKGVSKSLGGLKSAAGAAAKAAAVGFAAIGAGAVVAGGKAIAMGSDVEEMMGKFNVVFGDYAESTVAALDEFGAAVGRNKFELREMASTMQDTFVPMGFARGEAADLSVELTKLAVDVASFNNASDTEVMEAFQSAIVGNHETVRQFGIVITEATLKQEALRLGLVGTTVDSQKVQNATEALSIAQQKHNKVLEKYGAESIQAQQSQLRLTKAEQALTKASQGTIGQLSEQAKIQARLSLITQGTTDAQGDAERTAGSWANTMRGLQSAISETVAEIGVGLLPVFTPMLQNFKELAQQYGPLVVDFVSSFVGELGLLIGFIKGVWVETDTLNDFLADTPEKLRGVYEAVQILVGGLRDIKNAFDEGGLAAVGDELWSQLIGWWDDNGQQWATDAAAKLGEWVASVPGTVVLLAGDLWNQLNDWWAEGGQQWAADLHKNIKAEVNEIKWELKTESGRLWNSLLDWWEDGGDEWSDQAGNEIGAALIAALEDVFKPENQRFSPFGLFTDDIGAESVINAEMVDSMIAELSAIDFDALGQSLVESIKISVQSNVGTVDWSGVATEIATTLKAVFTQVLTLIDVTIGEFVHGLFVKITEKIGLGNFDDIGTTLLTKIREGLSGRDFSEEGAKKADELTNSMKAGVEQSGALHDVGRIVTDAVADPQIASDVEEAAKAIGDSVPAGVVLPIDEDETMAESFKTKLGEMFDAAKSFIDSESPSVKAAEEIGQPIMEGVTEGFLELAPEFSDAVILTLQDVFALAEGEMIEFNETVRLSWRTMLGIIRMGYTLIREDSAKAWAKIATEGKGAAAAAGRDMGEGLKAGVLSKADEIAAAAARVVRRAIAAARAAARAASPSQEMLDLGHDLIAGLTAGIDEDTEKAVKALASTMTAAIRAASDALKFAKELNDFKWSGAPVQPILDWLAAFAGMATVSMKGVSDWSWFDDMPKDFGDKMRNFSEAIRPLVDAAKAWETVSEFKFSEMSVKPVIDWLASFAGLTGAAMKQVSDWSWFDNMPENFGQKMKDFTASLRSMTDAAKAWKTIQEFSSAKWDVKPVIDWLAAMAGLSVSAILSVSKWKQFGALVEDSKFKNFTIAITDAFKALSMAIEFMEDLRMWKHTTDLVDKFIKFRKALTEILIEFDVALRELEEIEFKAVTQFSEALGGVMNALNDALNFAMAIPDTWTAPAETLWLPFVEWVFGVMDAMKSGMKTWFPMPTGDKVDWTPVKEFSDAMSVVMSALKSALEFSLAFPRSWEPPNQLALLDFRDWVFWWMNVMKQMVKQEFTEPNGDQVDWTPVKEFSDAMSAVMSALKSALEFSLVMPNSWESPNQLALLDFRDWVFWWMNVMKQMVKQEFTEPNGDQVDWTPVKEFSDAMSAVMSALKSALEFSLAMPNSWGAPNQLALLDFRDWVFWWMNVMKQMVKQEFTEPDGTQVDWTPVKEFSDAMASVMSALKSALEFSLTFPKTWEAPNQLALLDFRDWVFWWMNVMKQSVKQWFIEPSGDQVDWTPVKEFSDAMSAVMGALKSALEFSLAMPDTWSTPDPEMWGRFRNWVFFVMAQMKEQIAFWFPPPTEGTVDWTPVTEFANAIGPVMNALKSALEFSLAMPDTWGTPDPAMWSKFRDWVFFVMAQMKEQVAIWFPPPTEGTADWTPVTEFANAMGPVFTGLTSALEMFDGLVTFVSPAHEQFVSFLAAVKLVMTDISAYASTELVQSSNAAVTEFGSALSSLFSGLQSGLSVFDALYNMSDSQAGWLAGVVNEDGSVNTNSKFVTAVANLVLAITATLETFKNNVMAGYAESWAPAAEAFSSAVNSVFGVLSTALGVFGQLDEQGLPDTAAVTAFVQAVLDVFNQFTAGLELAETDTSGAITGITNAVGQGPPGIAAYNQEAYDAAEGYGKKVQEGLVAAIGASATVTGSIKRELWFYKEEFRLTASNIHYTQAAAGAAAATEFGNRVALSLQGQVEGVGSAASDLGSAIVTKIHQELGMASPSKEGIYVGQNFANSLAIGMNSAISDVQRSATALGDAMLPGAGGIDISGTQPVMTVRVTGDISLGGQQVNPQTANAIANMVVQQMRIGA